MVVQQEHVTEWNERKVASWLELSGFGTFVAEFEENGITGDVLVELDRHTLKDVGIMSVGRRVMLLKAIQGLREQHGMPTDCGNVTPMADSPVHSEASYGTRMQTLSPQASPVGEEYKRIRRAIADRDIQKLAQEVERLSTQAYETCDGEQVAALPPPTILPRKGSAPARQADSDSSASSSSSGGRCIKAVTRMRLGSENHDYRRVEQAPPLSASSSNSSFRPRFQSMPITPVKTSCGGGHEAAFPAGVYGTGVAAANSGNPGRKGDRCGWQNFRIRRDDKCFEVLPAVLKNCQVEDDWRNYTLYIAYGTGQRHERPIDHEEKVYPIMRTLKGENPVFVLKRTDTVGHRAVRR